MASIPDFWTSLVLSCQTCFGSVLIFGILHTYPSLKPTFTLTSHLGKNVGLGEG